MSHAIEKYQAIYIRKMLDTWPDGAPEELRSMSKEEAMAALEEWFRMRQMPDQELTPELAQSRATARKQMEAGFQEHLKLGRMLLNLRVQQKSEAEFWNWLQKFAPVIFANKEHALAAMEAAQEHG